MDIRIVGAIILTAIAVLFIIFQPVKPNRERATVTIRAPDTPDSDSKAVIDARVADTPYQRYRGLSGVEELEIGEGMLFAFPFQSNKTMVMRGMQIGLDIVFIDANRTITEVHQAPPPSETDTRQAYSGRAKYVLELPYGYTDDRNIMPGDHVAIGYEVVMTD